MFIEGALSIVSDPICIALILLGTFLGIVFGAIPGLTATMAVTVFLPITYSMNPTQSLSMLMALYIGGISGGLISAILLKIPGTPSSATTTFDGVPMAEKGEAPKALGMAIFYSFLGTVFGVLMLCLIAPFLTSVAIKFGPYEYCTLSIFSLSLIIALTGKDMIKGLASAIIGVMLGTIGISKFDSVIRFNFGMVDLMSGLSSLTVSIALFAITQILGEARKKNALECAQVDKKVKIKGLGFTRKDFKEQFSNFLISALIGTGIGILPGIGGGTSAVISYTTVKNKSKHPELFGTGIPDGVVASETSNNAAIGGAMIPLLTLGIPGDGITAVLLGALMVQSVSPGPLIFQKNGEVVYAIYTAMLIAAVAMLLFEYLGLNFFVKVLAVPKYYLIPIIAVFCLIGAFGVHNNVFNVWVVLAIGVFAFILKELGFPMQPIILGSILGPIFEENVRRAEQYMSVSGLDLLNHPIAVFFAVLTVVVFVINIRNRAKIKK